MLALLCGGQGTLGPGTYALTAACPEAVATFAHAASLLGRDPRALVRGGGTETVSADRTSQLLTVTASLAVHACIREHLPRRLVVAGYSVGEMAAWCIAGVWSQEIALRLTEARAAAMDCAGGADGRLGYVRGLPEGEVARLAKRHRCAIAIRDPGGLFVLGGRGADVAALCEEADAKRAHAGLLAIRIASHTPLLAAAVARIQAALDAVTCARPAPDRVLLAGGGGTRIFSAQAATAHLAGQVAETLDWSATLEALGEYRVDQVLDLGPGHALADMARQVLPRARVRAADAFRSIEGLRAWLAQ